MNPLNFEITPDNEPYLNARGKIILNACPGSGKTTAISYKMTSLVSECNKNFGPYAGIACLSFTNVAKDEIASRYTQLSGCKLTYPHVVTTIDSFVNQYITLPFYHLLGKEAKRPTILNTVSFLDNLNLGWFVNKRNQPLKVSYPPSKIKIEADGTFSYDGTPANSEIVEPNVFLKYARKFKGWQIEKGYLTNDDSTFIASLLLKRYPTIGESLARRFPYIIVDEAQDTSEIQYKIFDYLIAYGLSNIEFVGDPYQSLYEFREARPDLFVQRFNNTAEWLPLRLINCRRTSQNIIDTYSVFRNSKEEPIISVCSHKTDHKLHIIRYDENNLNPLLEKYRNLTGEGPSNYVLVRGGKHLEMFGVKPLSIEPWKSSLPRLLLNTQLEFENQNIKACIDGLRSFLAEMNTPDADHRTKKEAEQNMKGDIELNVKLFDFVRGMPPIDDTLENWTSNMNSYIKENFDVDAKFKLKQKGKKFYTQNLKDLLYPRIQTPFPISTIHKVKGMTFRSIMLVLDSRSGKESLTINDFVRPADLPNERQRMIYVALSRPETLCCLAVPDSFSELQISAQLGTDVEFVK